MSQDVINCGLVTPYGDIDIGSDNAWRHQAISWTKIDLSSIVSSQEDLKIPISKTSLKLAFLNSHPNVPEANELSHDELK